jgi:predicted GNAT family acetyltransferase
LTSGQFFNGVQAPIHIVYSFAAMEQVLDNPAWNALITGNKHLALGNKEVKFFDDRISPFAGLEEYSANGFQQLYNVYTGQSPKVVILKEEIAVPQPWVTARYMKCLQMVYNGETPVVKDPALIIPLNREHVPQMLELTALTNPGPFAVDTISFGHYTGIFDEDKLVAMAGQRMNPQPYAEISAVCTHPDYVGKGFAKQLLLHQVNRVIVGGGIPFLHVLDYNERAIKVYESLGFQTRTELHFYVIQK